MTLSKQLIIIISIVFAILFVGTLMVSINNMRAYLTQQLESHAQDTASSLGLSLTPHFKNKDFPLMNSMVDAIFDRGYYQEINIKAIDGTPLIERKSKMDIEGVPAWFINSISLNTPQALSTISSGWKQAARVTVRSHPGYAYLELWNNTVETFTWFLLSFTGAIISFIIVLRYILLPLKLVEQQALSITRREFPILKLIPKTRELKRVVVAMNKMSAKVKKMLTEQTDTIERVQKEAYVDKLTGLANRRSFDMELKHVMSNTIDDNHGLLMFVRIKNLEKTNNEQGYQQGDMLIKQVTDVIKRCLNKHSQAFIARIAGGQFGIIITGVLINESNMLATELAYQIPLVNIHEPQTDFCHIGGACYQGKKNTKDLLAKADLALQTSLNQKPNSSLIYEMDEADADLQIKYGAQLLAKILRQGIAENSFVFFQQAVKSVTTKEVLHYEIFTHLIGDDGEIISGMNFIPMAEKMGLMPPLDKNIVENIIKKIKQNKEPVTQRYSVNISPASFHDDDFVQWLYQILKDEKEVASQLILETSEYVVSSESESFKKVVNDFQGLGCRFSLDHFGTSFTPFGYLHDLKLDYIKIHGGLVRGVSENKDNRFFIQSLCQIAHGLDIQVIGEFVEKEVDYIVLKQLGLDAVQGYYIGQVTEY